MAPPKQKLIKPIKIVDIPHAEIGSGAVMLVFQGGNPELLTQDVLDRFFKRQAQKQKFQTK